MTDLLPEDELLLAQARRGLRPSRADRARIKGKLFARIGVGAGAAASAIAGSASAAAGPAVAGGTAAGAVVVKVVAALIVAGAVGTGVVMRSRTPTASGVRPVHASVVSSAAPMVRSAPNAEARPSPFVESAPTSTASDVPEPSAIAIVAPHAPPERARPAVQPTAPSLSPVTTAEPEAPAPEAPAVPTAFAAAPSGVAAETDLLRQADLALKGGSAGKALGLLDEHAARFPRGALVEEREAERIVVLCALSRVDDARVLAAAFLRDRPRSPLSARVRASCGAP